MVNGHTSGRGKWAAAAVAVFLCAAGPMSHGQQTAWQRQEVNLKVAAGLRVRAINFPKKAPFAVQNAPATPALTSGPTFPIDGFVPYVAITLTNKAYYGEFQYAHVLANSVVGVSLNSPMSQNYAIGTLDTGGTVNIIGQCDRDTLGVTAAWLTGNTVAVGGAGGQTDADVTQPLGMFVAGLQAIDPATGLDTTKLCGHWNVSAAIPQEAACNDIVDIPTTIGTAFVAFRDVWIRNDHKRTVVHGNKTYTGPEVGIYTPGDPTVPDYPIMVPLDPRPTGLTTSAYYPDLMSLEDFRTPGIPTALTMMEGGLPTGGWFVASVWLQNGTRPEINKYFMVDTGAQISLMRQLVAVQIGLNLSQPDFTVEVTGVAGDITIAPGFYVDSLRIDSSPPDSVVLAQVPMIVLDVPSVEGGTLDGIVGTNVFSNRNLAFKPNLAGSSTVELSLPFPRYGDFDGDFDVDMSDFGYFQGCFNGPNSPPAQAGCENADADQDGDVDLADFLVFQECFNGPDLSAGCL